MRSSEAASYIQHIASLGLGQHIAIPVMMKALEDVVPSRGNPFFWTDSDGMVADAHVEVFEPGVASTMMETRHNSPDDVPTFDRMLIGARSHNNVQRLQAMSGWGRSTLHNVLLKEYDALGCMDFVVRDRTGVRGFFAISRSHRDKPLVEKEMRKVLSLVPHFVHAIDAGEGVAGGTDACAETQAGFVVADVSGEVVSYAGNGRDLMLRLYNYPIDRRFSQSDLSKRVPPAAMLGIERLRHVQRGRPGEPATLVAPTRWGDFRVSAYSLESARGGGDMFMVSIVPLIDRRINRAKRLARTDLTRAEQRVAMRMAERGSGDDSARDLGLSTGSYRQYAKRIYSALGVDGRLGVKAFLDG